MWCHALVNPIYYFPTDWHERDLGLGAITSRTGQGIALWLLLGGKLGVALMLRPGLHVKRKCGGGEALGRGTGTGSVVYIKHNRSLDGW